MAAACDGADPGRFVWIDLFTVRQWPGNVADLDFKGVVARCSAFMLVCTYLPSVAALDGFSLLDGTAVVPAEERRMITFFRVWCLVEIGAAVQFGVPLVMKGGEHDPS